MRHRFCMSSRERGIFATGQGGTFCRLWDHVLVNFWHPAKNMTICNRPAACRSNFRVYSRCLSCMILYGRRERVPSGWLPWWCWNLHRTPFAASCASLETSSSSSAAHAREICSVSSCAPSVTSQLDCNAFTQTMRTKFWRLRVRCKRRGRRGTGCVRPDTSEIHCSIVAI